MSILDNWQQWKDFLGEKVITAQKTGMEKEKMSEVAFQIGDYLAKNVDPKNEQERVLADLWKAADENEQHVLANLMIRLAGGSVSH
ncbi:hypothetical protein KP77_19120 [Jeotgalibacillus alimentarius]|uniref:Protein YmfJ n=2 Tax=Jeotgalibacillus TaxID=157226 RepID=A0A0C2VNT0_9BACL|nr:MULTISPECIES: DUF3243 domain-containing protein [Jeotgalibacillus]KIL50537.1 hypothetical protein KP77_19120 [Jeotgalibacillus alimentarius]MBM7579923.1 hypothetical protein [Jeotgalibacillus terrae]